MASVNPSTGDVLADVADADQNDVDLATSAARTAFEGAWRSFTPAARQRLLWRIADTLEANYAELKLLTAADMGAPVGRDPNAGAEGAVEPIRYFAGWATKINGATLANSIPEMISYTRKEPVGVVAAYIPFNSPFTQFVKKLGAVLAAGCTMVAKPADQASLTILRIAELCLESGLPPGVLNVVTGGPQVGSALAESHEVDSIVFTGSTRVGQKLIHSSAGNLKRLTLELGGKSPNIIFADADLERAVPTAAMMVFANSGQGCSNGTRLFVQRPVYDRVVNEMAATAEALRVGNSLDPETVLGPVISGDALERILRLIQIGSDEGARLVTGGSRLSDEARRRGFFVAPTIFAGVRDDMVVAREEIFGPVASIFPFDSESEVIARANSTDFGLAGGVWTQDISKAHRVADSIQAGTVWINAYNALDPAVPFGGYKLSGWGKEGGEDALSSFLNTKAIWVRTT